MKHDPPMRPPRDMMLSVRVTRREFAAYEGDARQREVTLSEWLRAAANAFARKVRHGKD